MRDYKVSFPRAAMLHPKVRQEVIDTITWIENNKFPPTIAIRIVQGLRTKEEQDALFAQGRTKPGPIVTKVRWDKTWHFPGLAFDFALLYDMDRNGTFEELSWNTARDQDKDGLKDWDEVIAAFIAKGWESGAKWRTFPDYPHLQKPLGYTLKQLADKYTKEQFIPGTNYLEL